ncbi:protein translocase subunit SecD [Moritella sp. 28]|uniref:protein translocase subunit SecD n=1 Tax=Moritella sp. 28 TaxID=2746232 RepID=UPI001BA60E78|nr:protein translocase subunit SecD [Moritella sp. 28]QUM83960.1 protein translocase subunit SecD [Moritella sp. 28]
MDCYQMTKITNSKVQRKRLNHYAGWKYVVLICTVLIMLLSAIPTIYGEDPALQINHKQDQQPALHVLKQTLEGSNIAVKRIDQDMDKTTIVLTDLSTQTRAKAILEATLPADDDITLALVSAAPSWLQSMGLKPIKLGLDLRGGVQFLLDVDMEPVFNIRAQQLVDNLRTDFREEGFRGVRISINHNNSLQLNLPTDEAKVTLLKLMHNNYPQWKVTQSSGLLVEVGIAQTEKTDIINLTVQQNLQTMRSRIAELGITEAMVQRQGEHRIRIELPGVQDPATAKNVIGATASLAFHELETVRSGSMLVNNNDGIPIRIARDAILGGEHIIDARASVGEIGAAEVNITLDNAGGKKMSSFTKHNIGKPMATLYSEYSRNADGSTKKTSNIISVATIQAQLGSQFRITGAGNMADAQELALLLRAGSLTAPVTIVEERTIGPSLGADNIQNGFSALALGLGLTLVFMALWYRRLGWVANIALIANIIILFGLLALIPGAVLTLPGIAGLVLTVGMAVDTNVLVFERIRDKLREGRSFAQAIDCGFDSAFATILDANITTLIIAVVLYSVGRGPVQGFALTLGLGILTSMFTGILVSRALINKLWGRDTRHDLKV